MAIFIIVNWKILRLGNRTDSGYWGRDFYVWKLFPFNMKDISQRDINLFQNGFFVNYLPAVIERKFLGVFSYALIKFAIYNT